MLDNDDGTYTVSFTAVAVGKYNVSVRLDGKPVAGHLSTTVVPGNSSVSSWEAMLTFFNAKLLVTRSLALSPSFQRPNRLQGQTLI